MAGQSPILMSTLPLLPRAPAAYSLTRLFAARVKEGMDCLCLGNCSGHRTVCPPDCSDESNHARDRQQYAMVETSPTARTWPYSVGKRTYGCRTWMSGIPQGNAHKVETANKGGEWHKYGRSNRSAYRSMQKARWGSGSLWQIGSM